MEYAILSEELPTDNPVVLMEMIARSEALGDQVARDLRESERNLARANELLSTERSDTILMHKAEKVAVIEAYVDIDVSEHVKVVSQIEADIKYLKRVSSMIERRCSLGQSFLSHMTAQLKAGIGQ